MKNSSLSLFFYFLLVVVFTGCSKEKRSDKAAEKMQEFVVDISTYARMQDSDFIIIPQNGIELAFTDLDVNEGKNAAYMSAINGFGVEELNYNGSFAPDNDRLSMLRILKDYKKILVSDFVNQDKDITDAIDRNAKEGFISFTRAANNYDYTQLPDKITNENATDILNLALAQNYLYLINTSIFSTKEEMIQAISKTNYDVVLIDLFFDETALSLSEINKLKTKANGAQRLVIAYISIGSAEKFRYYWKKGWGLHHPLWLRRKYAGYKDEFWVKFWRKDWQDIIYGNDNSYMKKILDAGFDGAYLDNVEAYYFLYHKD